MLMIRLRRTGAKKDPHYRVVVADRTAGRDGAFLEILGHYHPRQRPAEIVFDMERTEIWLGQGARMSDTVRNLYRRVRSGRVEEAPVAASPVAPSDEELEAAAEEEAEVEAEAADLSADSEGDEVAQEAADSAADEPAADADTAEGEAGAEDSADEEAEEKPVAD